MKFGWFVPVVAFEIEPKGETTGLPQLYVVPDGTNVFGGLFTGLKDIVDPLQILSVVSGIKGEILIVAAILKGVPTQKPGLGPVGVIWYVAVCAAIVGLFNVWAIVAWFIPDVPPVNPFVTAGIAHE